jgi:hypothetical protein
VIFSNAVTQVGEDRIRLVQKLNSRPDRKELPYFFVGGHSAESFVGPLLPRRVEVNRVRLEKMLLALLFTLITGYAEAGGEERYQQHT